MAKRPQKTDPRSQLMLCMGSGKLIWVSRRLAKAEARRDSVRYGYPMFVYRCRECDLWHLTRSAPRPT